MHRPLALLCVLACACPAATAPAPPLVASVQATTPDISAATLEQVRARRVLLITGDDRTPLANGLRKLAKADPRYAARLGSPWSGSRQGGTVMIRRAETGVRADKAVEALAGSATRLAGSVDLAVLDLSSEALPDGSRIAAPVRFFTASMEIDMTHASLNGSMVDNIRGTQLLGGTVPVTANFPIELPNIGVDHIHTAVGVPAGSASDDGGWRMSPRDPRQTLGDVVGGLEALGKGVQPVYATLPLERSGNAQRNWYNLSLRAWCAKHGRPLLDVAEILSTGTDGTVAKDAEGPRLADAWDSPEQRDEGQMRVARAWWWLQSRLAAGN